MPILNKFFCNAEDPLGTEFKQKLNQYMQLNGVKVYHRLKDI